MLVLAVPAAFPVQASLPHEDLLRGPVPLFRGPLSETWQDGPAATRRYEALRRWLGGHLVTRSTSKTKGFKTLADAATVEIRYAVPRGATVPAIETRKAVVA